jgi:hypothetical protein
LSFKLLTSIPNRAPHRLLEPLFILLFTLTGFAVMGYHPGLEDDAIYLTAVKADLDPLLYPHDADFFRLQTQATVFDGFMAAFVRVTHMPVAWAELLWQLLSLYTILWAAHRIAQRLFAERRAQWAGIALLAAMFTLPVAGTALNLADQHLHPRTMATALILVAVERTLANRKWQAFGILLAAMAVHPIMASFGISFCLLVGLVLRESVYLRLTTIVSRRLTPGPAAAFPLSWILEPPTPEWRRALNTRTYYFLYQWTWYEWLGAIGPGVLFWLLWRWAERHPSGAKSPGVDETASGGKEPLLARFAMALLLYGVFQQCVAMALLAPSALVRVTPLQPMRYLHLEYIFLVLIAGGLLGRHALGRVPWRWALFLVLINAVMFFSQEHLLPASEHLELPGNESRNAWLQSFEWIRQNTPRSAHFALDPGYLGVPGEDYHSFRALAERSQMADALKDAAVVTQVPELAPVWVEQVDALAGWNQFQLADFERLKQRFGVDWVLLSNPPPSRLTCVWHNEALTVCRIPTTASSPAALSY